MKVKILFDRAKNILINPQREWKVIKSKPDSVFTLLVFFAGPLIFFASAAVFISIVGVKYSTPLSMALLISHKVFIVNIIALIATAFLAYIFSEKLLIKKDFKGILSLVLFSSYPFLITQVIANLIPDLFFIRLGGFYGLYILWTGINIIPDPVEPGNEKHKPFMNSVMVPIIVTTYISTFYLSHLLLSKIII